MPDKVKAKAVKKTASTKSKTKKTVSKSAAKKTVAKPATSKVVDGKVTVNKSVNTKAATSTADKSSAGSTTKQATDQKTDKKADQKTADKTPVNHAPEFDLREMLAAGAHFGHQKAKWNPQIKPFVYMEKDGVHIFDLVKTAEQLKKAYNKAYQLGKDGKTLIIVGTKRQAKDVVEKAATESGAMYISSRWLGGFLSNWNQVQKSLKRMLKIEQGLENGEYDNYTKYERVQLEKEQNRLERFFIGVKDLQKRPDALFIVDTHKEDIPVKEANNMGIFTIGLVDSNANPNDVDIAIPANDDGRKSIEYFVNQVAAGFAAGKADQGKK